MLFHLFFFECYGDHRDLHGRTHSFPTRRSADLRTADLERSSLERDARGSSSVVPHLGAAHRRGRSSLPPLLPGNRRRIDQIASVVYLTLNLLPAVREEHVLFGRALSGQTRVSFREVLREEDAARRVVPGALDRKSTSLNSSH